MKTLQKCILLCTIVLITGCDCDDEKNCIDSEITSIVSTVIGGWNPITDSLTLKPGKAIYYHSCEGQNPVHENLNCMEWSQLTGSFDLDEFNALNLNSCSSCVDGYDISISVKTITSYHRIVIPYTAKESQGPDEIRKLYERIEIIRSNLRSNACED